jgi:hypothetical protein
LLDPPVPAISGRFLSSTSTSSSSSSSFLLQFNVAIQSDGTEAGKGMEIDVGDRFICLMLLLLT